MVGESFCFVPGCTTGYESDRKKCKSERKKVGSLFSPPLDPELLEEWKRKISRPDRELTRGCRVCELHFEEDNIERFFVVPLVDGSVFQQKRAKPCLKKGSIPSLSLNLRPKKRKNIFVRTHCSPTASCSLPEQTDEVPLLDVNHLVSSVEKPNNSSSITATESFLMGARWNNDYIPKKRPVIQDDLSIKEDSESSLTSTEDLKENSSVSSKTGPEQTEDQQAYAIKSLNNIVEKLSSPPENNREDIFGRFVASEMKVLTENPLLYLQTKQAILEVLTSAHFERINPEEQDE